MQQLVTGCGAKVRNLCHPSPELHTKYYARITICVQVRLPKCDDDNDDTQHKLPPVNISINDALTEQLF
jgi:hypothetical protein